MYVNGSKRVILHTCITLFVWMSDHLNNICDHINNFILK